MTSRQLENRSNCAAAGCANTAGFHVTTIDARRSICTRALCELHGRQYLPNRRHEILCDTSESAFELSWLIYDVDRQQGCVKLEEVAGRRSCQVLMGSVEATALRVELDGIRFPRPLTHHAMAGIISSLGASLAAVLIYRPQPLSSDFHADLRLRRGTEITTVDVRPSDAIILAIVTGAPILVRGEVKRGM